MTLILQDSGNLDAIGAIWVRKTFSYGGTHNVKMYDEETLPNSDENYLEENGESTNVVCSLNM